MIKDHIRCIKSFRSNNKYSPNNSHNNHKHNTIIVRQGYCIQVNNHNQNNRSKSLKSFHRNHQHNMVLTNIINLHNTNHRNNNTHHNKDNINNNIKHLNINNNHHHLNINHHQHQHNNHNNHNNHNTDSLNLKVNNPQQNTLLFVNYPLN